MAIFGIGGKKDTSAANPADNKLPEELPTHIGIIMDGNGRWAKKRGMPRTFGHREGAKTFRKIVRYCKDIGVKNVSFYAFSTENWNRPTDEVSTLMELFAGMLDDARDYIGDGTRVYIIGDKSRVSDKLREKMIKLEEDTKEFSDMNLLMCFSYGGRDEIARAAKRLAIQAKNGEIDPEDINEQSIADNLYTAGLPDVDLVIRPSGEYRLSNYLIWQCAYAEYYFTDTLWPDFSPEDLNAAIIEYSHRKRRFGGV